MGEGGWSFKAAEDERELLKWAYESKGAALVDPETIIEALLNRNPEEIKARIRKALGGVLDNGNLGGKGRAAAMGGAPAGEADGGDGGGGGGAPEGGGGGAPAGGGPSLGNGGGAKGLAPEVGNAGGEAGPGLAPEVGAPAGGGTPAAEVTPKPA